MKKTMRLWLQVGCAAGLALSLNTVAKAQVTIPDGTAVISLLDLNGNKITQTGALTYDPETGKFTLGDPLVISVPGTIGPNGTPQNTVVQLGGASGTYDPILSYSFSATNNNLVATPFTLDLSIPILPVNIGSVLKASFGLTLTDGANDGIQVSPTGFPLPNASPTTGFIQTATGDGFDLGTGSGAGIDIGTTTNGIAGGTSVTPFNSTPATSPFAFSNLDLHLSFFLTPGSDNAGFTGRVEVTDVPEPGVVAMMAGLGFSGSVFALRRKRNAKLAA